MKNLFVFAILVCIFSSCSKYGDTSFKWLEGRWEQQTAEDTLTESWARLDDGNFDGSVMRTDSGKSKMREQLRLERREGTLYYVATVPGQNNGQPVYFKYRGGMSNTHVFENTKHDFPQRIIYEYKPRKQHDSIIATVEGTIDGKTVKEQFRYGRME